MIGFVFSSFLGLIFFRLRAETERGAGIQSENLRWSYGEVTVVKA